VRRPLAFGLAALVALGGVAGGTAWLLKRPAQAGPPEDEGVQTLSARPEGAGFRLEVHTGDLPLRGLRWVGPLPGGVVLAQIATQNDRQLVAVFRDGQAEGIHPVPRPAGVGEGLFNHAELMDAVLAADGLLVLLYRPLGGTEDNPALVLALDLPAQALRWCHRAQGQRLSLSGGGKDAAVFLHGGGAPILRLPLALQKGEREGLSPVRPSLKPYELPPEIGTVSDLAPTGAWTFLLAHGKGLSLYQGTAKGWIHFPPPALNPLGFPEGLGALARTPKGIFWQAEPGAFVGLKADGTLDAETPREALAVPDPSLDGAMLRLFDADPEGGLWFRLAKPSLRAPVRPAADPEAPPVEAPVFTAAELLAWETHLQGDLDRLYRFDPVKRTLQRFTWRGAAATAPLPEGFSAPAGGQGLRPAGGAALVTAAGAAWWVPLKALPLEALGNVAAPAAVKAPEAPGNPG
jgi:hypothetical protein